MADHTDIQRIAAKSFADHRLTKGPGFSWRMGRSNRSAYSFRVTWAPGVVCVSGDVGEAVYQVWPSFSTLWDAVDFISRADFDYLCEKGNSRKEFDRDATVDGAIQHGYESLRHGSRPDLFERLCDEYGGDADKTRDRKDAVRAFRDDQDLTAARIYDITGDGEDIVYSYPPGARWTYEAAKLWAATMKAQEPAWHRAWRWVQRERAKLRGEMKARRHFRPALYVSPKGYGHVKHWVRLRWEHDGKSGERMAAVIPFRPLGLDLSCIGLWREQGSSTPLRGDRDDERFEPLSAQPSASGVAA
ncbi:hypothetical protein [Methylorubrum salsuginis]|uniref:Uncharacterized protein n=1 Tax=Methylorubrum salsuginis TaxID=414703 RepID=A0A1I4FHY7_9HYPH|nr:hypothetical protein [Methylorubrum salsuginis]SFL17544.1 hypothetical protein SAMN04488125_11052 [Methylorubrum salsuginis]